MATAYLVWWIQGPQLTGSVKQISRNWSSAHGSVPQKPRSLPLNPRLHCLLVVPSSAVLKRDTRHQHAYSYIVSNKLKNFQIKLHINPDVRSICQLYQGLPLHICQKVEDELLKLEVGDIIQEVSGPTPWVPPIITLETKPKDSD